MSKRILFLSNHFITLFCFRKELIELLAKEGYDVVLSLPKADENAYFVDLGCKVIDTPIDRRGVNPINDLKLLRFYKTMIPQVDPDIIFSYTIKPNIYGTLATNHTKYRQICNITGTGATFLKKNIVSEISKILYRFSIKKAYKVFFQNNGDKDFFVKNRMIGDNYEVIPGSGCNLQEHPHSEMPSDEIVRFIYIGRVMQVKGIDNYLEAAAIIKQRFPHTEFLIAGFNEEQRYQDLVEEYGKKGIINYIGFRKDLNDWIKKCHCAVLPSLGGEGIPNVLLESEAIGRACIGSNIDGIRETIEDGVSGYLFRAGDSSDLASVLGKFINLSYEEKRQMGLKSRKLVEEKFDRTFIINKYLEEIAALN